MKYKRVTCFRHGGVKVLKVVEDDLPEPAPNEVRVKILATGVCFADVMIREGIHPVKPPLPVYPGSEPCGIVEKKGKDVKDLQIGQLVAALTPVGGLGYAEYITLPENRLLPVPGGIDPVDCAASILNYLCSYQMLHRIAHVSKGEKILIHGAAGGVGTAFLQLGRLMDLEMYGTASKNKHDLVRSLGGIPIDYKHKSFDKEILKLTGDGVHAVFDPIGGYNWEKSFRSLNYDGRLIGYGFSAAFNKGRFDPLKGLIAFIRMPHFSIMRLIRNSANKAVMGYITESYRKHDWYREDLGYIFKLLAEKKISPIIGEVLPLAEVANAHSLLNHSAISGKIVLKPWA
jgi:NADPH2:quinone reductase